MLNVGSSAVCSESESRQERAALPRRFGCALGSAERSHLVPWLRAVRRAHASHTAAADRACGFLAVGRRCGRRTPLASGARRLTSARSGCAATGGVLVGKDGPCGRFRTDRHCESRMRTAASGWVPKRTTDPPGDRMSHPTKLMGRGRCGAGPGTLAPNGEDGRSEIHPGRRPCRSQGFPAGRSGTGRMQT